MCRHYFKAVILVLLFNLSGLLCAQTPGWATTQQMQPGYYNYHSTDLAVDSSGNIISVLYGHGQIFIGYPFMTPNPDSWFCSYVWKQDSQGNTIWIKQIDAPNVIIQDVGTDAQGNIYFTAKYFETITLGGFTFTPMDWADYIIAKLDSQGNYLWIKNLGYVDFFKDFSVGADGSCFMTGSLDWGLNYIGDFTLSCNGYSDLFVAKINSAGIWQWARQAIGESIVEGTFVTADNVGGCYIAGEAFEDVNFGNVSIPYNNNNYDPMKFVARYSANGACVWALPINYSHVTLAGLVQDGLGSAYVLYYHHDSSFYGIRLKVSKFGNGGNSTIFSTINSSNVYGLSLAIDSEHNLYILGRYYEPLSIGIYNFTAPNGTLIIKLNADYTVCWANDPSPGNSRSHKIAVSNDGRPSLLINNYENTYQSGNYYTYCDIGMIYIAGLDHQGTVEWMRSGWMNHVGSSGTDIYQDSGGYNYVCGNFEGDFIKDDSLYVNAGTSGNDIYLSRLTNDGSLLWISTAGSSGNDEATAIIADNNQNSYVTGCFTGTMQFGDISIYSNGDTDIFVAKADVSGNWLWAVAFGGSGPDSGSDIALDGAGNIYVTGYFSETVNIGGTNFSSNGNKDFLVLKLDSNGLPILVSTGGGSLDDDAIAIVPTSNGSAMVSGNFRQSASFDSYQLQAWGSSDVFIGLLDSNLNWTYVMAAGSATQDSVSAMATDNNGNFYLTGYFTGTAIFGNTTLQSAGSKDVFVAKFNSSSWQWAVSGGGSGTDVANAIAVNSSGTAFLTGYANSAVNFGPYTVQPYGAKDILCAAVNSSGTWLWAKLTGSWNDSQSFIDDWGAGITINSGGNCSVVGGFSGYIPFGAEMLYPNGAYETFISTLLDGVENDDPNAVPINDLALSCYPNPFKNNITIQIDLKQTSVTTLKLYNIRGELVKNIYDNALPKGKSSLKWDGKNEQHVNCASGIYILKAISGSKSHAIKLIKLK
jgi:hypothetical protein